MKGAVIAAPSSGSGKTIASIILAHSLKKLGYDTRLAKVGPDYIDPTLHEKIIGAKSYNIDTWGMRAETVDDILTLIKQEQNLDTNQNHNGANSPILLVEGVTGLFDGSLQQGEQGIGGTAEVSRLLGLPIILIMPAKGSGFTIGPLASGLLKHDAGLKVAGVIATDVASDRHAEMIRNSVISCGVPWLGYIKRSESLNLKRRHLGLFQGFEQTQLNNIDEIAAQFISTSEPNTLIKSLSHCNTSITNHSKEQLPAGLPTPGKNIAIAIDNAFSFVYFAQLKMWQKAGSHISTFSPINDEAPCSDADCIFLPGGYPELYLKELSSAQNFKDSMRKAAASDTKIYGECGGYMVLGECISDIEGKRYKMLDLLPHSTQMQAKCASLGYRLVKSCDNSNLTFRAHEFHYAKVVSNSSQSATNNVESTDVFCSLDNTKKYGHRAGSVSGSFLHLIDLASHQQY